jgi:putative endonuclease
MDKVGYVYMVASARNGTLYIGVTSDLLNRTIQHREGLVDGFSKRYGCKRLVWNEAIGDMDAAILREKQMKRWKRRWKLRVIEEMNPDWDDLYDTILP